MNLLIDEPKGDRGDVVILAHGAGAPMDSPFLSRIAAGLASEGIRVVRFEFPYMAARRERAERKVPDRQPILRACWLEAIEAVAGETGVVIGGKSLGGRIASVVADEAGVRGLVCLGYPFHPPGRPERTRTDHLADLRTPTLVVQGTRDPFGTPAEVRAYHLSPSIRIHWINDGDHSLGARKRSGRTTEQNLAEAVATTAAFVRSLRQQNRG